MSQDRNGLEVLDRDACLELLSSANLGRIGSPQVRSQWCCP
jgi:hypothetical protein